MTQQERQGDALTDQQKWNQEALKAEGTPRVNGESVDVKKLEEERIRLSS